MANAAVYYFSATGNSLYAAKSIAQALDGDLFAVQEASVIENTYDVIGFVFPTFSFGMPRMVEEFITRLEIAGRPYIFGVATCALSCGAALADLDQILRWKGQSLSYGRQLLCPENNIFLLDPGKTAVEKKLCHSSAALKQIAGELLAQKQLLPRRPFLSPLYRLAHRKSVAGYAASDKSFLLSDRCTGCGLCQRVCPAGNIVLKEGRPAFLHQCEHCSACLQWCPQQAISWKGTTQSRTPYRHPQITPEEIQRLPHSSPQEP